MLNFFSGVVNGFSFVAKTEYNIIFSIQYTIYVLIFLVLINFYAFLSSVTRHILVILLFVDLVAVNAIYVALISTIMSGNISGIGLAIVLLVCSACELAIGLGLFILLFFYNNDIYLYHVQKDLSSALYYPHNIGGLVRTVLNETKDEKGYNSNRIVEGSEYYFNNNRSQYDILFQEIIFILYLYLIILLSDNGVVFIHFSDNSSEILSYRWVVQLSANLIHNYSHFSLDDFKGLIELISEDCLQDNRKPRHVEHAAFELLRAVYQIVEILDLGLNAELTQTFGFKDTWYSLVYLYPAELSIYSADLVDNIFSSKDSYSSEMSWVDKYLRMRTVQISLYTPITLFNFIYYGLYCIVYFFAFKEALENDFWVVLVDIEEFDKVFLISGG